MASAQTHAMAASIGKEFKAYRRADPVEWSKVGDDACDEKRCGHDVTVMIVEEVSRREEALGSGAADEDEVVPVEVALECQDRADGELDRDQGDGGRSNPVGAGQPDCHTSFLLVGGTLRLYGSPIRAVSADGQRLHNSCCGVIPEAFTLDE